MPMIRKQIKLRSSQAKALKKAASRAETTASNRLRQIVEDFLKKGSTYRNEPLRNLMFSADADLIERAEAKAMSENGCSLQDIIRHEVSKLPS